MLCFRNRTRVLFNLAFARKKMRFGKFQNRKGYLLGSKKNKTRRKGNLTQSVYKIEDETERIVFGRKKKQERKNILENRI